MLPSLHESVAMFNQERNPNDEFQGQRRRAARLFWQAYSQGKLHQLLGRLARRDSQLQDMAEAVKDLDVKARHHIGARSVPIQQVRGSEGRSRDFDADFHPLARHTEERWIGLAAAQRLGVVLPPVELIQVGEIYFVRDGHHRISVARSLGQKEIDALVTVWEL